MSGTLLDMMLGQIEGFVSAGEVREHGCVEDRPCGCGEPFSRCPFWSAVGEEAFGGWERLDLDTILRVRFHWGPALAAAPAAPGRCATPSSRRTSTPWADCWPQSRASPAGRW